MKPIKGYDVIKNGKLIGFFPGRSKKVRQTVINAIIQDTQIGYWHKFDDGSFEYVTNIGVYLEFVPIQQFEGVVV